MVGPSGYQRLGGGKANPSTAASDERDLSFKLFCHDFSKLGITPDLRFVRMVCQ